MNVPEELMKVKVLLMKLYHGERISEAEGNAAIKFLDALYKKSKRQQHRTLGLIFGKSKIQKSKIQKSKI